MNKILQAAIDLIAQHGWSNLSFTDIALQAEVPLDQVYQEFGQKSDIISAIGRLIDLETLSNLDTFSDQDSYRDKLFSVLMTRFDVAAAYKPTVQSLWLEARKNPMLIVNSATQGVNSMVWMLEAAQIDVSGTYGTIKAQLFGVFYLSAVNSWLQDDSPDLTATMAYIDRGLEKFEMVPGFY